MPRLSVWFVRASLCYLVLGFSLGSLLLYHKGIALHPLFWSLLPAHIEFLLLGWVAQLIAGVAFWILPRFKQAPKRGRVGLAWAAFGLLNLGIVLVVAAPYLSSAGRWAFLAGRLSEGAAVVAFGLHAWPRVKASGE